MLKIVDFSTFFSFSSYLLRDPDRLWLVNIDPVHKIAEFFPGEVPDLGRVARPAVPSFRSQPFVNQDEPVVLLQDRLDPVGSPSTKEIKAFPVRFLLHLVLDDRAKPVDGFTHICISSDQVDPVGGCDIR